MNPFCAERREESGKIGVIMQGDLKLNIILIFERVKVSLSAVVSEYQTYLLSNNLSFPFKSDRYIFCRLLQRQPLFLSFRSDLRFHW